jgi:hypothetical protein
MSPTGLPSRLGLANKGQAAAWGKGGAQCTCWREKATVLIPLKQLHETARLKTLKRHPLRAGLGLHCQ